MRLKKTLAVASIAAMSAIGLTACNDADVASHNISKGADNFEIDRRIVFINGISDEYLLEIEGKCSLYPDMAEEQIEVTCKTGEGDYKKHYMGLSDNVTYLAEQINGADVDPYHYRVTFKPEAIIPDIDLRTSGGDN